TSLAVSNFLFFSCNDTSTTEFYTLSLHDALPILLGQDLVATTPQEVSLLPLTHAGLDISDTESMRACVEQFRPELIINAAAYTRSEEHTSELQSLRHLVCRLLLEKKKKTTKKYKI